MAVVNSNPFWENWFKKPPFPFPLPLPPFNFLSYLESLKPESPSPPFAAISFFNPFKEKKPERPKVYKQMLEQFYWESVNRPDYRHAPEVEKILNEDPVFEKKENPTQEETEENEKWWKEFNDSPVIQFFKRSEEIADKLNQMELQENSVPYKSEDKKYWQSIPHVLGPDGRPMPRKAIKTKEESEDKFWDFVKQYLFGLWGYQQRPYPPGRPIDVAQAIGYKGLERRYYDFIMRTSGFFYKDRLGRTRGPCELIQLKTAWGAGIIDKHTFIWGDDMDEWAPIGMIYGMERAIATWEVRLAAAATAFIFKLRRGIPPWVTLKGFEKKTRKQLQEEAYESKRRDLAVLEANDGEWPGVRIPSHALFLWASGSELTSILENDHMPNKYVPKTLRKQLAKAIPGLRPSEVLSLEQAMELITYNGEWYREPLGTLTRGPDYIHDWNIAVRTYLNALKVMVADEARYLNKHLPAFRKYIAGYLNDEAGKAYRRRLKKRALNDAKKRHIVFPPTQKDFEEYYRKMDEEDAGVASDSDSDTDDESGNANANKP